MNTYEVLGRLTCMHISAEESFGNLGRKIDSIRDSLIKDEKCEIPSSDYLYMIMEIELLSNDLENYKNILNNVYSNLMNPDVRKVDQETNPDPLL